MKTKIFTFKNVDGRTFKVRSDNELDAFQFAIDSYGWARLICIKDPRKTFRKQVLFY